jgi:hypothetical protein
MPLPWSPLQATHVSVVVLHRGVVPLQAVEFEAEHWVQEPLRAPLEIQAGVALNRQA